MLATGWQAELLFGVPEVLVPACHLVNDLTIRPDPAQSVSYHHIWFDRHQIVLAEGCPAESFFPGPTTMAAVDAGARADLLDLVRDMARSVSTCGPTARMVLRRSEVPPSAIRPAPAAVTRLTNGSGA